MRKAEAPLVIHRASPVDGPIDGEDQEQGGEGDDGLPRARRAVSRTYCPPDRRWTRTRRPPVPRSAPTETRRAQNVPGVSIFSPMTAEMRAMMVKERA